MTSLTLGLPLPDFLTRRADGEIVVTGTRVMLHHVLSDYNGGQSPEMIGANYPHIPVSTLHRLIAHYLDHKPAVDGYLAEYEEELLRLRQTVGRVFDVESRGTAAAV